jgi:hypothetical protein
MSNEIAAEWLERPELELYQRRALQRWRRSDWLAQKQPAAWDSLADFPIGSEVWMDLGGGAGESQHTPGAIVVGTFGVAPPGQHGQPDISWDLASGIPAAPATIDKLTVAEDTMQGRPTLEQRFLLREMARVLRVGGTLLYHAPLSAFARASLEQLGFVADDTDTFTLTTKTIPSTDLGEPIFRETTLGETTVPFIRRPI